MPNLEFRLKQDVILSYIIGCNSGQFVAPTAYGKTFLMLAMTALYPRNNIIIASPSQALLDGTYRRMVAIAGSDVGRTGGGHNEPQRVTLTTYKSIMRAPTHKCDILLIDESHRVPGPQFSADIASIRSPIKIFGMSASPDGRSDQAELVTEVLIGPKIYEITYQEAVDSGIISKIGVRMIPMTRMHCQVKTDYRDPTTKKRHGYWRNIQRNTRIAQAVNNLPTDMGLPDDPQVLILVETAEQAFRLKQLLPDFELVYGTLTPDKRQKFTNWGLIEEGFTPLSAKNKRLMQHEFEAGNLRKVIATSTWGEGVDFVYLDVLVNAGGASSKINVTQWSGRNSRIYEGKSEGLLIDCGDEWSPWARRRARDRLKLYADKGWEVKEFQGL
jgi:superfamily II DNA or RNA helicase